MGRLKNIVHSEDACTLIFKGDKGTPEPSLGVIRFPGGYVEVSRCSDGSYYAHICADESVHVLDSRIDYDYEKADNGIPEIPDHDHVKKLAMKIKGPFLDYD